MTKHNYHVIFQKPSIVKEDILTLDMVVSGIDEREAIKKITAKFNGGVTIVEILKID